jgi:hypothetical protein
MSGLRSIGGQLTAILGHFTRRAFNTSAGLVVKRTEGKLRQHCDYQCDIGQILYRRYQ